VHENFDGLRVGRHQYELGLSSIQRLRSLYFIERKKNSSIEQPKNGDNLIVELFYLHWRPFLTACSSMPVEQDRECFYLAPRRRVDMLLDLFRSFFVLF
jgi:hypothetical protein